MRNYQNASAGTIEVRRHSLTQFLIWLGPNATVQGMSQLTPDTVERFFLRYAQGKGSAARRSMQSALRTFFRFCLHQGHIKRPLDRAVPTLRTYKLATLPCGLTEAQARKVLKCPDRATPAGRRDYAILMLMYTYGVRSGQIRALRLADINWAENKIFFRASKHGKDALLPLTPEVGKSLLGYLRSARSRCQNPEVFLTCRAPYRPLGDRNALSEMVRRHILAAGLDVPRKGAHVFRHGFATRMLRKGHSLKAIADVLGHRHLGTTFLYTKVDFNALKQAALPWPQEVK
jgi:site-specific recombinase XerD